MIGLVLTPSGFRFESPAYLWLLLLLLAVFGVLGWRRATHREPALAFSAESLLAGLPRTLPLRLWFLPLLLRFACLAAMVVGLARPQLVGPPTIDDGEGIDIVLALDTSCSMRAVDFQPNDRMFVAKKSVSEFVLSRKTDRIGLVVFAGDAASWVPLTLDYSLLASMLEEVETGMLKDGTAIGDAIGVSINRIRKSEAKSKVIVLLTDGDNNAGALSPTKAAEFAKELGIKIYTILIGTGGAVPFPAGKDIFGRVVLQKQVIPANPELLAEIARTTGGEAFQATDKSELDENLGRVLDALDKSRLEASVRVDSYEELFPWFVLIALGLGALELLLSSTRFRRFP